MGIQHTCQENVEHYNAVSSLLQHTCSYHEEPAHSNTTRTDVTLRQNLFGTRHVSCRTHSAWIQCGKGRHLFLMDRLSGFTQHRRVEHPFGRYFGLSRILVRRGFPGFSLASIGFFMYVFARTGLSNKPQSLFVTPTEIHRTITWRHILSRPTPFISKMQNEKCSSLWNTTVLQHVIMHRYKNTLW
jgi:hypothetical protein